MGGEAEKMILATLTLTDDSVVVINGEGALTADMVADYVSTCRVFEAGKKCTAIGANVLRNCSTLKSVVLSDSVLTVGTQAFRACTNVTNIDLGHGVTSLFHNAFYDTTPIEIHIPASLTSMGKEIFSPSRAVAITVEEGNTVFDSRENCNCLMVTSTDTLLLGCVNSLIPNTCKNISSRAFVSTSITSITIPEGVLSISGFSGSSLSSITIPNSVTSIGSSAFNGSKLNTSITIPDSVATIGQQAFRSTAIPEVVIGSGVTSIGSYAFNCSKLAQVTILAVTPPTLGGNVFAGNKAGRKIYVPSESVEAYKAAANWSTYADDIEAIPT